MILVDFNQIAIANASIASIIEDSAEVPIDTLRFMILDSIRMYNQKFKEKYGELIICCDGYQYWRRDFFEHYKAGRRKERDAKWDDIFLKIDIVREELKMFFPYKFIRVSKLEADDVIAILSINFTDRQTIVVSGDKDFQQLQRFSHVQQYSPGKKEFVICESPNLYLKELIIRGDRGDGIPNILSPGNAFVDKIRQSPVTRAKLDSWLYEKPEDFCTSEEMLLNYQRNKTLIAFTEIPEEYTLQVKKIYSELVMNGKPKSRCESDLEAYFQKNNLRQFEVKMGEFF